MRRRSFRLCICCGVVLCGSALLFLGSPLARPPGPPLAAEVPRSAEPPPLEAPRWPQVTDTLWFGGVDEFGVAIEGGTWDWDTHLPPEDPRQGWTRVDQTTFGGDYFRRITHADSAAHGDPCDPVFPTTGALIWCSLHEDEARWHDFAGGMGYGNRFGQEALSPELPIDPAEDEIEIRFLYFSDTELDFDFSYVVLLGSDALGDPTPPFEVGTLTGVIGAPDAPALFEATIPAGMLPPETRSVRLALRMQSDGGWSDEDGSWDTPCGALAADDVSIRVGEAPAVVYDFEEDDQGWSLGAWGGVGAFMQVVSEDTWWEWLEYAGVTECTMSDNALAFADVEGSSWWPPGHPEGHLEMGISNSIPRGELPLENITGAVARWDTYTSGCGAQCFLCYRIGYIYYPYTTETQPEPRWSPPQGSDTWWYASEPSCFHAGADLTNPYDGRPLPTEWDSLRVVYQVNCWMYTGNGCPALGAPIIDNLRAGILYENPSAVDPAPARPVPGMLLLRPVRTDPLSGTAVLHFALPATMEIDLAIYDSAGRRIRTLAGGSHAAGEHSCIWDGNDEAGRQLARGVYRARLRSAAGSENTRPVLVMR